MHHVEQEAPTSKRQLEDRLRAAVPCPDSDDPFVLDEYEVALRRWVNLSSLDRDISGFSAQVMSLGLTGV